MSSMGVFFHDVGQGDCTHIEVGDLNTPNLRIIVVDFGYKPRQFNGENPPNNALRVLVDRISYISIQRGLATPLLDHLFITHPDEDHWNMLSNLVNGEGIDDMAGDNLWELHFPVGTTLTIGRLTYGGDPARYTNNNAQRTIEWNNIYNASLARDVLDSLSHDNMDITGAINPSWTYLGLLNIYLLSSNVPVKVRGSTNPKSLVLMLEFHTYKILLQGDAEPPDIYENLEDWYNADMNLLNCFAIKLSHHGSRRGSPTWWGDATRPTLAFASGDYFWAHPYGEAFNNIDNSNTISPNTNLQHWWASYNDMLNDYDSANTRAGFFSSLWYVITPHNEFNLDNVGARLTTDPSGTFIGVTWLLQLFNDGTLPYLNFEPNPIEPAPDAV